MANLCSVYKLRCRIASPGATVLPPSSSPPKDNSDTPGQNTRSTDARHDQTDSGDDDESQEENDADSNTDQDEWHAPIFVTDQCLFCGDKCGTFDKNVTHMAMTHSFIIPYQDCLAVDLETLIWYLHLAIYGYIECIFCGTRRNSLEAVQQHMMAKGHCRFDISPDTEDFYEIPACEDHESFNQARPDEMSLRLPSGKLLGRRSQGNVPATPQSRSVTKQSVHTETLVLLSDHDRGLIRRKEKSMAVLAARVSQLSTSDQNSLSHLSSHEVRSVLATRKRQLDTARRIESRARSKVDRNNNKTLMKHFVMDCPGRSNG